jgi:hypothetical protein
MYVIITDASTEQVVAVFSLGQGQASGVQGRSENGRTAVHGQGGEPGHPVRCPGSYCRRR